MEVTQNNTNMLIVKSVNISEEKGTVKRPVDTIELISTGVKHDAHSGKWHRQVSLLGTESIQRFSLKNNQKYVYGDFAENITTEGLELKELKPFDELSNEQITLQITQIGKKCHGGGCAIYQQVGECVMPTEGIFTRVLKGGTLKAGDLLTLTPKVFTIKVITLSDRASSGEYPDKSGPLIDEMLHEEFNKLTWRIHVERIIIPDSRRKLKTLLQKYIGTSDIIITTGGTGIGVRDITVEAVLPFIDKEIPGIMDMIRIKYGMQNSNALLSRSVAGVRKKTLLFTLPGSPKACREYLSEINPLLKHLFLMLYNIDGH